MSQTKAGAKKARATMMEKYGKDYYKEIGKVGGQNGNTGGFYKNSEAAREAGRKGGLKSKRGPAKPKTEEVEETFTSKFKRAFSRA